MKRREFGQELLRGAMAAGMAGSLARGTTQAQGLRAPRKNTLMHVGGDYHSVAGAGFTSKENLEYNLRFGVRHLTAQIRTRKRTSDVGWDADELKKMKDDCDQSGVTLEAIRMDADCITGDRRGPRSGTGHPREYREAASRREGHHVSLDRDSDPPKSADHRTGQLDLRGVPAGGELEGSAGGE